MHDVQSYAEQIHSGAHYQLGKVAWAVNRKQYCSKRMKHLRIAGRGRFHMLLLCYAHSVQLIDRKL